MKKFLFLFSTLAVLFSCAGSDDDEPNNNGPNFPENPGAPTAPRGPFNRTVLFYISGENSLSTYIANELKEIRKGSKGIGNNAVVVYVDDSNARRKPYILWLKEGITIDSLALEVDPLSSSQKAMSSILNYTSTYYPADEYGIVLWGHASGWLLEDSVETSATANSPQRAYRAVPFSPQKAYGIDNGKNSYSDNGQWMNISTLAQTLWNWKHLKFIFADCCQFQCVETAYELRNVADYIIGSPAEIPGEGAPYETVVKGLFDPSETFYRTIVDSYFEQVIKTTYYSYDGWSDFNYNSRTPLSVIKTAELRNLADATNTVLHTFITEDSETPDLSRQSLIYYCGSNSSNAFSVMYDMNDLIRKNTVGSDNTDSGQAAYETWKEVFDRTVIYRKNASEGWMTNRQIQPYVFRSGILTDERYGGMSMFVPQTQNRSGTRYLPYTLNGVQHNGYNADIRTTAWYAAARLAEFGW